MDEIKKVYYSIGEVAQIVNRSSPCIRFWLSKANVPLKRGKNNHRYFTPEDVEMVKQIDKLLRVDRYTVTGALLNMRLIK